MIEVEHTGGLADVQRAAFVGRLSGVRLTMHWILPKYFRRLTTGSVLCQSGSLEVLSMTFSLTSGG